MRILYDHQAFTIQEYGGISRYFYELILESQRNPELAVASSLLFSNNEYIKDSEIITSTPFFKSITLQRRIETMNLLNEMKSKSIYKRAGFDLFHPTYYDPYYLKIKSTKPIVITFHDLIHEKFKQEDQRTLKNKRLVLGRADKIIAVSQSSKNDLMEYYKIPEDRISIVHLASSIYSLPEIPKLTSEADYLLYVGGRNHYKNFIFFVEAIVPLLIRQPQLYLYCVGGGKFTREERSLFKALKIESKVKLHSGSDESLTKFYSNALAFFFPSIYEGFGIPLLEAMNCGCPVGASQTSSLPEVAGNAALYFDPTNKDSILSAAETLVCNPAIREKLRQKGFLRAKDFSWQKTAELTHDVYTSFM